MTWLGDIGNWGRKAIGDLNNGMTNATRFIGNHAKGALELVRDIGKKVQQGAELADSFGVPFSKTVGKVAGMSGAVSDALLNTYFHPGNNAIMNNKKNRSFNENVDYIAKGVADGLINVRNTLEKNTTIKN